MKKFINLFTDEVNRNASFTITFILILFILELLAIFLRLWQKYKLSEEIILASITVDNKYFIMVLGFATFGVLVFTWFSWFREWHLQGRYIYRLMLLPGSRIPIAWAKWASIIFLVLIMIGVQIFLLSSIDILLELMVSNYTSIGWKNSLAYEMFGLNYLLPINLGSFLTLLTFVSIFVLAISNFQLIFLSYFSRSKIKALSYAIIYILVAIVIFSGMLTALFIQLNPSNYEAMLVTLIVFIVFNLMQGLWMTYFTQHHLSI